MMYPVVVLVNVQGVEMGAPFSIYALWEVRSPIFSLCAFKDLWAFVYDYFY